MAINKEKLAPLKEFVLRTVEINEKAILGIIPRLQKNTTDVLEGWRPDKNFWYRQKEWFEDFARRSVLARFLDLATLIYGTDRERGEIYIQFVESFFACLRAIFGETAPCAQTKTFWELEEQNAVLLSQRRKAVVSDDKQMARELSQTILRTEEAIPMVLMRSLLQRRKAKRKLLGNKRCHVNHHRCLTNRINIRRLSKRRNYLLKEPLVSNRLAVGRKMSKEHISHSSALKTI